MKQINQEKVSFLVPVDSSTTFQIFVKDLDGSTKTILIKQGSQVEEIKEKVYKKNRVCLKVIF